MGKQLILADVESRGAIAGDQGSTLTIDIWSVMLRESCEAWVFVFSKVILPDVSQRSTSLKWYALNGQHNLLRGYPLWGKGGRIEAAHLQPQHKPERSIPLLQQKMVQACSPSFNRVGKLSRVRTSFPCRKD